MDKEIIRHKIRIVTEAYTSIIFQYLYRRLTKTDVRSAVLEHKIIHEMID